MLRAAHTSAVMRVRLLTVFFFVVSLSACSSGDSTQTTIAESGLTMSYTDGWSATGFSTSNSPPRLAVASYPLPDDAVEGDCGGSRAVELLPAEGGLVIVIDYGRAPGPLRPEEPFSPRRANLALDDGQRENFDCIGDSTMFRFRVGERDIQAHVALGQEADDEVVKAALAIVESISLTDS